MSPLPTDRDIVAAVLDLHRWKTMGLNSVQCECGVVLATEREAALLAFPADALFRDHLADKILEALR